MNKLTPKEAVEILWRKGVLSYKLDKNQKEVYDIYKKTDKKIIVLSSSRQIGKTTTMSIIAVEACVKNPNTVVKFLAPTQKMVRGIIKTTMREILQDCPEDLKPEYKTQESIYVFKNGSEIQIAGADSGRAENIRGGKAHLIVVDEAGFITDLKYIVQSILLPTTTMTKGKILLASTPPVSPDHDFVKFLRQAEYEGTLVTKTIYDNPRLTKEDIDGFAKTCNGYDSIDFRREYLAEILKDENYALVPEFDEALKKKLVVEWPKPAFFDGYVSMDLGVKDLTVVLFSYYDFKKDKLIIEDEYVINGQKFNTNILANAIRQKENEVFVDSFTKEYREPYLRVSDNNLIVINDLWFLHGLRFLPTRKDDANSALNDLRIKLADEKIVINPKCKTLIKHLSEGVWNKKKTSFDRSSEGHHYDAIDSLKYLVRNIVWNKNPYPAGFESGIRRQDGFYNNNPKPNNNMDFLKKIFKVKG